MICCDTCPFEPTCEEEDDFRRHIFGLDDEEEDDFGRHIFGLDDEED